MCQRVKSGLDRLGLPRKTTAWPTCSLKFYSRFEDRTKKSGLKLIIARRLGNQAFFRLIFRKTGNGRKSKEGALPETSLWAYRMANQLAINGKTVGQKID